MKPTLYLLVGYPGAGKTTTSHVLHTLTGAEHLWADQLRKERYQQPTYSHIENTELYNYMNGLTAELLASGKSVIFDTNFNFLNDRKKLVEIAKRTGAKTVLLWVRTPLEIAKQRATEEIHQDDKRVFGAMSENDFERLSGHLEEPSPQEHPVVVDGTKVTPEYLSSLLFKV